MKDIGYYAGFLNEGEQDLITAANKFQLCDLLIDLASHLYHSNPEADIDTLDVDWETESDRDKIALIRGLCDRIELKLMEAAQ